MQVFFFTVACLLVQVVADPRLVFAAMLTIAHQFNRSPASGNDGPPKHQMNLAPASTPSHIGDSNCCINVEYI